MPLTEQRWANKTDAARYAGVDRTTIIKWAKAGNIRQSPKRAGEHQLVDLRSIDEYLGGVGNDHEQMGRADVGA